MEQEQHWVVLTRTGAAYEADVLVEQLRAADIPVLVRGPVAGIFGYGYSGFTPQGTTLLVPSGFLDEARSILEEGTMGSDLATGEPEE